MASMIIKGRDGRHVYTRTIPPTTFNSGGNEIRSRRTNPFFRQLAREDDEEGYVSTLGLNLALL